MLRMPQTVILGLGPLGRAALEHYKRRAKQTYGELPAVKLLCLDVPADDGMVYGGAADEREAVESILDATELMELDLDAIVNDPIKAAERFPWLPEKLLRKDKSWRSSRAAARLAFHLHARDLLNFLEYHLAQLGTAEVRDVMYEKGFDITTEDNMGALVVVGGLGDSAGSGMILDATYLMHYLFRRAGLQTAATGIFFLPPASPSDALAEARTYATLKELNACMDGKGYVCDYPGLRVDFREPPYNRGCYLVDTRNERQMALTDQHEATVLVGEWLFRTMTTPLKARIDVFVADTGGATAHVQHQLAGYTGLGLATYTLPIEGLIQWSAGRLCADLITSCFLRSESASHVSEHLTDFFSETRLRPDSLIEDELRLGPDHKPIDLSTGYDSLLKAPYAQILPRVKATLARIKEEIPRHKRQVEYNARRVLQDVESEIDQKVKDILLQYPMGGLSLATQFVQRLRQEAARFQSALDRRALVFDSRNKQQINQLNRLGPSLERAVTSIPPTSLAVASLFFGIVTPLALTSVWLRNSLTGQLSIVGTSLMILAWLAGIAAVAYSVWRTINGVSEVRGEYVQKLKERFDNELKLSLVDTARNLYPEVTSSADNHLQLLRSFQAVLNELARNFKRRSSPDPLCGDIDFALQRSVLTPEIMNELYIRYRGPERVDAHLTPLMDQMGTFDIWRKHTTQELEPDMVAFGSAVFGRMRELRAETLLQKQLNNPSDLVRRVRELQDKAAPLWLYDQFALGDATLAEARTFVGADAPSTSELCNQFQRMDAQTIFETTNDSYNITVTRVRRGMPLFGLRRMEEFRTHYLNHVIAGRETLHTQDEYALMPDLSPLRGQEPQLDAGATVAVGRALQILTQNPLTGKYGPMMPGSGESKKWQFELSADLVDCAILLASDREKLQCIANAIDERVAREGVPEIIEELGKYKEETTPLTRWEINQIEDFVRLLRA